MISRLLSTTFALALIFTPSLHAQSSRRLAASTISLTFDTPPRPGLAFHYRITLKPNRTATIWYVFGPGNAESFGVNNSFNPTPPTTQTFQLSPSDYRALLAKLDAQGILATDWPANPPPPIGGPRQIVTVRQPSHPAITLTIPPLTTTLKKSAAIRFVTIIETIRGAIPSSAWMTFNTERQAYATANHLN